MTNSSWSYDLSIIITLFCSFQESSDSSQLQMMERRVVCLTFWSRVKQISRLSILTGMESNWELIYANTPNTRVVVVDVYAPTVR